MRTTVVKDARRPAWHCALRGATLLLACSALLVACSSETAPATQVAAKVNGSEISVHQLNFALGKIPGVPSEMTEQTRREVLGKLIDQEIAVQRAADTKLDRTPEVIMAIDAARKEVLARAYVDQVAGSLQKPVASDVKQYYDEHPQLFSQRRIFSLQEIIIPAQRAPVDKLTEMVKSRSMEDIAKWLKQQNVPFSANAVARAAEQIPLDLLPKVQEVKDGQTTILQSPQVVSVFRVVASESAPIDEKSAEPRIQQFLMNQRVDAAVSADLKQLRDKAAIELAGSDAKTGAPKPAGEVAPTVQANTAPVPNLDKGVRGLK